MIQSEIGHKPQLYISYLWDLKIDCNGSRAFANIHCSRSPSAPCSSQLNENKNKAFWGFLLLLLFSVKPYNSRLVPCPNSEIAACYHPSDLLRTVAHTDGGYLVSLQRVPAKNKGVNDLGEDLEWVDCGLWVLRRWNRVHCCSKRLCLLWVTVCCGVAGVPGSNRTIFNRPCGLWQQQTNISHVHGSYCSLTWRTFSVSNKR